MTGSDRFFGPMKRFSIEVVLAAVAVMIGHSARGELVDRVAAVVNTQIITLSEVEKRAAPELALLADSKDKATQRNRIIREALEQLVADKLMDWQLQEQHVEVSDQEVDAAAENLRVQNKMDNAQLEKALSEQGMTVTIWKNDVLRKQLARLKLIRTKVEGKVKISEDDIKSEYQKWARMESEDAEIHARHILIKLDAASPPEAVERTRQKAQKVSDEARQPGVDFAELAKKRGEGSSAQEGGDLGFFRRGVMLAEFEKVAFSLKAGEVSDPVRTSFGWHVIKLEERRTVPVKSYQEMQGSLREKLRSAQLEKASESYIRELKDSAVVELKI
jgi:peptidyl-prolyl cis-trans isomerase SurA